MVDARVSSILQKEVSRQEFLVLAAFGIAGVLGLTTLLKMLGKENPWTANDSAVYGGSSYGKK